MEGEVAVDVILNEGFAEGDRGKDRGGEVDTAASHACRLSDAAGGGIRN